jgi:hypothetical protein
MASCAYMLNNTIGHLKTLGMPFHNPYKTQDKRWNPLQTIGCQILYDFLSCGEDDPYWDTRGFLSWAKRLKVTNGKKGIFGLIRKQGKELISMLEKELAEHTPGLHTSREYISEVLAPEAVKKALNRDIEWLLNSIAPAIKTKLQYPNEIYVKNGCNKELLIQPPKVIIGTIHSFKGTEADNVFIFPDLSFAAVQAQNESIDGKDNLHRLMYVGATRTLDNLFIMKPGGSSNGRAYAFPNMSNI